MLRHGVSYTPLTYLWINDLLFDHIDGFEFFSILLVSNLNHLPLLQEGTTAKFLALGSSHNRPC